MASDQARNKWRKIMNDFKEKYKPTQKISIRCNGLVMPFDSDGIIYGTNLQKICDFAKKEGVFIFLTKQGVEVHE
jgi:hypothetical protein